MARLASSRTSTSSLTAAASGRCEDVQAAGNRFKTEGFRGGGMDAETEVDMGQDAMTATYTFADPDPENFKLVGLSTGNSVRTTAAARSSVTRMARALRWSWKWAAASRS
jgi:phage tail tube protein FII